MNLPKTFAGIFLFTGLLAALPSPAQHGRARPGPGLLVTTDPSYVRALKLYEYLTLSACIHQSPEWSSYHALAGKCIYTLLNNCQEPVGGLKHEGIYPSYTVFRGFWAWDSWKQAYALAYIDASLAKNNIRAMFDYQDTSGMVPDCIFQDPTENNFRNTKPPLAAWAVEEVVKRNGDTSFVAEMLPLLLNYHRWWYTHRDHDGNGLCEYGCTDGTLEAARWESGWDNAVRFDSARMVRNGREAWSMTQESADLNAYLYMEKRSLAALARVVGSEILAERLDTQADTLKSQMQRMMWDDRTGFFYDIDLTSKKPVRVREANGWIPLWAGVATPEQAARVVRHMLDTAEFNTFVPLPTLAADDPRFSPSKGYWRGPVWLDQAWFGLLGMRNYGYASEADSLTLKLLRNCDGLLNSRKPVRENYDPLSGTGLNADFFSWSAAAVLRMMLEYGENGVRR